jgi:hypothetical protein
MNRLDCRVVVVLALLLVLASCAPGPNGFIGVPNQEGMVAGFWLGLWHGVIAPVTFVISLFTRHVQPYEVHNSGGWYNAGFVLGMIICGGGGGGGAARRRMRR